MLRLVLQAGCSLRGSSRAFEVLVSYLNLPYTVPSASSCRLWLLRLGYYKLTRPKEKAEDWILFIDHTNQLDEVKCLLILGLRLSKLPPKGQAITLEDLEPIELFPVSQSNGEIVYQQLERAVEKIGIPRALISDHGSDLKSGVEKFIAVHPETISLYDIKHKTAALLKRELKQDERWEAFTKKAAQTQNSLRQTPLFPLVPPTQKTKARYMNLKPLVQWGVQSLFYLEATAKNKPPLSLRQEAQTGVNPETPFELPPGITSEKLQEKLEWVQEFKASILQWDTMLQSIICAESCVRNQGLEHGSLLELKRQLAPLPTNEQTSRVQQELLKFVEQESMKALPQERLPGSTESLESTFGKLKALQGIHNKNGFTTFILAAAAIVAPSTPSVIYEAMSHTQATDPGAWGQKNLGKSAHAKRKMLADQYRKHSEIAEPLHAPSTQEAILTPQKQIISNPRENTPILKTQKTGKIYSFILKVKNSLNIKMDSLNYKAVKTDQLRDTG